MCIRDRSSGDRISFNKNKHLDGFLALKSYKDYLFATYSGKPKAELDLNGSSALVPTTILAFDKSGNPLAKFTTPYKIRSIAFTDEKMYLLDLDCNCLLYTSVNNEQDSTPGPHYLLFLDVIFIDM